MTKYQLSAIRRYSRSVCHRSFGCVGRGGAEPSERERDHRRPFSRQHAVSRSVAILITALSIFAGLLLQPQLALSLTRWRVRKFMFRHRPQLLRVPG